MLSVGLEGSFSIYNKLYNNYANSFLRRKNEWNHKCENNDTVN